SSRGDEREGYAREMLLMYGRLAEASVRRMQLEQAADAYDELGDLARRLGEDASVVLARQLESVVEEQADRIEDLQRDAQRADDAEEHAELARGWAMEGAWYRALYHRQRAGAAGDGLALINAVWNGRRPGSPAVMSGLTASDALRLLGAIDRDDVWTIRGILQLLGSDPDFGDRALVLLAGLDADRVADPMQQEALRALGEELHAAAAQGAIRLDLDAGLLQEGLQAARALLDEGLVDAQRRTVLRAGLDLCTAVMTAEAELPQVLVVQARVLQGDWQERLASVEERLPRRLLIAGGPGDLDEARLMRLGWQQLFDHETIMGPDTVVENGIILHGNGIWRIDLLPEEWSELLLRTRRVPGTSNSRISIILGFDDDTDVRVNYRGTDVLEAAVDKNNAIGEVPQRGDDEWDSLLFQYDAASGDVTVSVNGTRFDTVRGMRGTPQLGVYQPPTKVRTLAIQSILAR
ncbi:MAG: hypothetical protein ACOCXA_09555, partial [Planctomycetota bacterium]